MISQVKFDSADNEIEADDKADIVKTAKNTIADAYGVTVDCVDVTVRLTL